MLIGRIFFYSILFITEMAEVSLAKEFSKAFFDLGKLSRRMVHWKIYQSFWVVLYSILIWLFILGSILELPMVVNRPYEVLCGSVKEYTVRENKSDIKLGPVRYDIIIEDEKTHKNRLVRSAFADGIFKGADIEIHTYTEFALWSEIDIVSKVNGKVTPTYEQSYDKYVVDRFIVVLLLLVNVIVQGYYLKREKKEIMNSTEKVQWGMWKYGVIVFSGLTLLSLCNVFDNVVIGSLMAISFYVYFVGHMLYLVTVRGFEWRWNKKNPLKQSWKLRYGSLDKKTQEELEELELKEGKDKQLLVIEKNTSFPETGEICLVSPMKGKYFYGIVLNSNLDTWWGDEMISLVVLKNMTKELIIKSIEISSENILVGPFIIEKETWYKGYFYSNGKKIKNLDDFNYGFYSKHIKSYVDEYEEELSEEPQIVGEFNVFYPEEIGYQIQRELIIDKTLLEECD